MTDNLMLRLYTGNEIKLTQPLANPLVGEPTVIPRNTAPGLASLDQWQGIHNESRGIALFAKTKSRAYPTVPQISSKPHSPELPKIISVPITNGFANYLPENDENVVTSR